MPIVEAMVAKAILEMLSSPPQTGSAAGGAGHPPASSTSTMAHADNFADAMRATLKCYHGTAKYDKADVIERPWPRQGQYAATQSAVVRIDYTGISRKRYSMSVAVMSRDGMVRTHLLNDNAAVPARSTCELENWIRQSVGEKANETKKAPQ